MYLSDGFCGKVRTDECHHGNRLVRTQLQMCLVLRGRLPWRGRGPRH